MVSIRNASEALYRSTNQTPEKPKNPNPKAKTKNVRRENPDTTKV
jgi:hypothetical protein